MNEDFYINLIYKKLTDDISPSERVELDRWVQASETNWQVAKDVESVWEVTGNLEISETDLELPINLDQEFTALEQRIQKEEMTKPALSAGDSETGNIVKKPTRQEAVVKPIQTAKEQKGGGNWRGLMSIAASIALVAVSSVILWNYFGKSQVEAFTAMTVHGVTDTVKLPDGTVVYLNEKSTLNYPLEFSGEERVVKFNGEAFFEVAHNPKQPFVIQTTTEEVRVLGTSFNIRAYKEEAIASVQVASGKVQLSPIKGADNLVLEIGNKGIYHRQKDTLLKSKKGSSNDYAWHSKKLEFVETSINKVVEDLETYFDVKINKADLQNCSFTSKFNQPKLETVLETIQGVLEVEVLKEENGSITLKGGNCK